METLTLENANQYCRTCLEAKAADASFTTPPGNWYHLQQTAELKNWITALTPLQTLDAEHYPQYICVICYVKLKRFVEYQELVKSAGTVFDALYGRNGDLPDGIENINVPQQHMFTDATLAKELEAYKLNGIGNIEVAACKSVIKLEDDDATLPEASLLQDKEFNVQMDQLNKSESIKAVMKPDKYLNFFTHKLVIKRKQKNDCKFWSVYAEVKEINGQIIENLVCCRMCYQLMEFNRRDSKLSLINHPCYENQTWRNTNALKDFPHSTKDLASKAATEPKIMSTESKLPDELNNHTTEESVLKFEAEDTEFTEMTLLPDNQQPIQADLARIKTKEDELLDKIASGLYKVSHKRKNKDSIWTVFGEIERNDGTIVENFVSCRSCGSILKWKEGEMSNLISHSCYTTKMNQPPSKLFSNAKFHYFSLSDLSKIQENIKSGLYKVSPNDDKNVSLIWTVFKTINKDDGSKIRNLVYCAICNDLIEWHKMQMFNLLRHKCYVSKKKQLNAISCKIVKIVVGEFVETIDMIQEKIKTGVYNISEIKPKGMSRLWILFAKVQNADGAIIPNTAYCRFCCELLKHNVKTGSMELKLHKCYLPTYETHEEILRKISMGVYSVASESKIEKNIWKFSCFAHVLNIKEAAIKNIIYCRLCQQLFDYNYQTISNLVNHNKQCKQKNASPRAKKLKTNENEMDNDSNYYIEALDADMNNRNETDNDSEDVIILDSENDDDT